MYFFKNFFTLIKEFFLFNSIFKNLLNLNLNSLKTKEIESTVYTYYNVKLLNEFYLVNFINKNIFVLCDFLWTYLFSKKYKIRRQSNKLFRSYYRVLSSNKGFYFNFKKLNNKTNLNNLLITSLNSGFKFLWLGLRFWIFPLIILFLVIYFTIVLRALPFNKVMFGWICVLMFIYWLLSGFVFFFKKYQFGKYTTAVQRFWRRSYILFWMIEGGTFLVFLYFTFNSSQESFYMYDQISVFKTHLYSWKFFLLKLFPTILLIILTYLLILSLKWSIYSKQVFFLLILTFFLSYLVWLEFYQFFHVLNFYGNLNWIYDIDDHSWSLELEPRRTRMVNHYIMLLFILKFWHIVFIYGFWIFFVLRSWETKRIRYPLLSANFQNFIILYIFAWVFMYPWFKYYFRKFLDIPYYWFYLNNKKIFIRVFFNDLKLIYYGFISILNHENNHFFKNFYVSCFYYWGVGNNSNNFEFFKKNLFKNYIVNSLIRI